MSYIGAEPDGKGSAERFIFTATSSTTDTVTHSDSGLAISYEANHVSVYLNGVKQVVGTDVTASNGSTLVFASNLAEDDVVEAIALSSFQPSDTVSASTGGTFSGILTSASLVLTPGSAPATTEGAMYYDSTSDTVKIRNASRWVSVTDKATGGLVTHYDSYRVHTFLSSHTFNVENTISVDYLIVGGAGGGGSSVSSDAGGGGGGGAGAVITATSLSIPAGIHTITVGAGGAASAEAAISPDNGNPSSIAISGGSTITAGRGGAGGNYATNKDGVAGLSGASGGGTGGQAGDTAGAGEGIGNDGGTGGDYGAGGGGGAGGNASNGSSANGGAGGTGEQNLYATGVNQFYGSGGGGGSYGGSGGTASAGGGGAGGNTRVTGTAGTANTGGGGGGGGGGTGSGTSGGGGAGGSGIVIIRYAI